MSGFSFATCERGRALEFLKQIYSRPITDTPDSAGPLLDFVERDVVRVQDPMMHGRTPQVIPGTHWDEQYREAVISACLLFHNAEPQP